MSRTYVPAPLRRMVKELAANLCEYCLIPDDFVDLSHEIDHVIAEKHGGETNADNLAYACFICNSNKGSDIASLSNDRIVTRLFHPRTDTWSDHFHVDGDRIALLTPIAEATDRILLFNTAAKRAERRGLQLLSRYPKDAD